jgi:hypothetical protein
MSMTINSVPGQGVGYGPITGVSNGPAGAAPANDFAAYIAPRVRRDTAALAGSQGTILDPSTQARRLAHLGMPPEVMELQMNVGLLNQAKAHVKDVASRLEDNPKLGLKGPDPAHIGGRAGARRRRSQA